MSMPPRQILAPATAVPDVETVAFFSQAERSPPEHTSFAQRNITPPTFSTFNSHTVYISHTRPVAHVAWSCDGRQLSAAGPDQTLRIWDSNLPIALGKETSTLSGGHSADIDYVSCNPMHPQLFCTSSSRDRRIVFWDARQKRCTQTCNLRQHPVKTTYAPDGRSMVYVTSGHSFGTLSLCSKDGPIEGQWTTLPANDLRPGSTVIFGNSGDYVIVSDYKESTLRVLEYKTLSRVGNAVFAHPMGCVALAMDPRGKYLVSGGHDSIISVYDLRSWIVVRTINHCNHPINTIDFSFDGEYLAVASQGNYINIVAVESGQALHCIPTSGPSPAVSWNPSAHAIAYCGTSQIQTSGIDVDSESFISTLGLNFD